MRNANRRLKEKSLVSVVKNEMSALCNVRVENEFKQRYNRLRQLLKEKKESDMLQYLENTWGTRAEQWAGYARIFAPFNTSMLVERFHKRLKYEYRGRVGNSRIDSIVNCLITAPEVIAHDFEIRMCRRLLYGRHRLTEQHKAHEAGIKALKEASIEVTDEGWKVRCKGTFFIKQKRCDCDPGLNNHCTRCDACPYSFYCTCLADSRAGVCCLHIHAAITSNPEGRHFVLPFKDDDNIRDACEDNNNNVIDVLSGDDSIYSDKENRQGSETDRMDRNKENLQRIETCWSRIKAYSFEIAKSSEGADILDHIADGMQKICLDIAAREERCASLIRRSELRAVGPVRNHTPIRLLSRGSAKL